MKELQIEAVIVRRRRKYLPGFLWRWLNRIANSRIPHFHYRTVDGTDYCDDDTAEGKITLWIKDSSSIPPGETVENPYNMENPAD